MSRLEGEIAVASEHFPIRFEATWDIEREENVRRISKTFLQSTHLRSAVGLVYKESLKDAAKRLDRILQKPREDVSEAEVHECCDETNFQIRKPWMEQV